MAEIILSFLVGVIVGVAGIITLGLKLDKKPK